MLLAVFLTAGFSLSAAQASIMPVQMAGVMAMPADMSMGKMDGSAMKGDCKACLKDTDGKGSPMQCPVPCIAPALAVLPQVIAVTPVALVQQPSTSPVAFLHGRSSLPDPYPPRPSA